MRHFSTYNKIDAELLHLSDGSSVYNNILFALIDIRFLFSLRKDRRNSSTETKWTQSVFQNSKLNMYANIWIAREIINY